MEAGAVVPSLMNKQGVICAILVALAANADAAEIDAYVGGQSVINDADAVQIGVTVDWEYVAIDLSHGIKRVQWRVKSEPNWQMDEWQSGSEFGIRVRPFGRQRKITPVIMWSHLSDITRGRPFNDKEEPSSDFIGSGFTVEWKRAELDIAYGWQLRECVLTKMSDCPDANINGNFMLRFRGYFWK